MAGGCVLPCRWGACLRPSGFFCDACLFFAYFCRMENWGTFIKEERQKRGFSLRQLGERACVPYPSIFAIESGKKDPQTSTLARLLNALGYELTAKPTRKKGNK